MGTIISDIGSDISTVIDDIGKLVTDVSAAVEQLGAMASGFEGASPAGRLAVSFAEGEDIHSALKAALNGAKTQCQKTFKSAFDGVDVSVTDNGVVKGYSASCNNDSAIVAQIQNDFKISDLPSDASQISQLATTIREEVQAQIGMVGTQPGHYYLTSNQRIDWVVAYGLFQITQSSQGLVYAFCAGLDSGFG